MIDKEIRRMNIGKLEIRTGSNPTGLGTLVGYAAVFNSMSEDMGFFERVMPGAFARALRESQDVRALVNHADSQVLGRTKSGTLRLKEDKTGLLMECDLPDTSYARDLAACIARGDIDQQSFSFRCMTDRWSLVDGKQVRDLIDLDLYDVSPVTFPAYTDTLVGVRSLAKFKEEAARMVDADAMRAARMKLAKRA